MLQGHDLLLKRRPDMSFADFKNWAENEHTKIAAEASRHSRLSHECAARGERRMRPMMR